MMIEQNKFFIEGRDIARVFYQASDGKDTPLRPIGPHDRTAIPSPRPSDLLHPQMPRYFFVSELRSNPPQCPRMRGHDATHPNRAPAARHRGRRRAGRRDLLSGPLLLRTESFAAPRRSAGSSSRRITTMVDSSGIAMMPRKQLRRGVVEMEPDIFRSAP